MLELTLLILYVILTLGAVFIAWKLKFAFEHFKIKKLNVPTVTLNNARSVSVCIPARNETNAMTQCLERVIASNYPKLEIIVLDDSSADNTSALIKAFASEGVRFVEGSSLPEGWLGKNHALQGLLDEASGQYILYMDVDTYIEPDTIARLVGYVEYEKALMVSVLPRRQDAWRFSILFSPMRYFWELILHRPSAPAVASSAWMIDRQVLGERLGGFESYKHDIQPEAKLAAKLMKSHAYRFIIGTPQLGVSYEKKWLSQIETSVRLLFPLFGGHLSGAIVAAFGLILLNLPLLIILIGLASEWTLFQSVSLWLLCVYGALYCLYLDKVWQKGWWLGVVLWPVVVAQECIILTISTVKYLRRTVAWKGRPVTSNK